MVDPYDDCSFTALSVRGKDHLSCRRRASSNLIRLMTQTRGWPRVGYSQYPKAAATASVIDLSPNERASDLEREVKFCASLLVADVVNHIPRKRAWPD